MQNSLPLLPTSCITACHILDFMVQGKITEANTPPLSPIFMPNALSATAVPQIYGLGQAPTNAIKKLSDLQIVKMQAMSLARKSGEL